MAYKGRFKPNNPSKYDGDPTNIIYRSGLELRYMQFLDSNKSVIKWSSEEVIVPYFDQASKRYRRYFPDFVVTVRTPTGGTQSTMVEVKPHKQCSPPTGAMHQDGRKNRRLIKEQLTFITNSCKWEAAESYCADRQWKFVKITEKDLGGY